MNCPSLLVGFATEVFLLRCLMFRMCLGVIFLVVSLRSVRCMLASTSLIKGSGVLFVWVIVCLQQKPLTASGTILLGLLFHRSGVPEDK